MTIDIYLMLLSGLVSRYEHLAQAGPKRQSIDSIAHGKKLKRDLWDAFAWLEAERERHGLLAGSMADARSEIRDWAAPNEQT